MSSTTRPDRRRASRSARTSKARNPHPRGAPARKPAPRKSPARPRPAGPEGSMLNTLIIVLLVVLAAMAVALFLLLKGIGL